MSTAFVLVYFLSINESTCQTRKNVFLFHFKIPFLFSRKPNFRILHFQISWIIKCLSIKKKYISLNNLGSKYSLLITFGQFMSYYKSKNFIKNFYKNCDLKTSSRPFCVCKEWSVTSIGKWNFWRKLLILGM